MSSHSLHLSSHEGVTLARRQAVVVFSFALLSALVWTFVLFPRFSPIEQMFDMDKFGEIGERLWRGEGFSQGHGATIRRAPLYPALIAGVFSLFGFDAANRVESYRPVFFLQCLFFALTCLACHQIALRMFGQRVALTAGLLCAVYPQCLRYTGAIEVECTLMLLTTLLTLAVVRMAAQPTIQRGMVVGFVLALAVLTKPVPLLYPLALGLILLLCSRAAKTSFPLRPFLACLGTLAAVCLPWVLRNHIVTAGQFHGISSNAPGEFLRGYIVAQPKYAFLRTTFQGNWDWEANLYEDALLQRAGFSQFSYKEGEATELYQNVDNALTKDRLEGAFVRERLLRDPLGFVRKFCFQVFTFWYLVESPGKSLVIGGLALFALIFAFIGAQSARKAGTMVAPIVGTVLYFNIFYAVVLALARYSMSLFPVLLVLTAHGLETLRMRHAAARPRAADPSAALKAE